MSISDAILNVVIFLIQKLLLPILPTDFSYLGIDTFTTTLNGIQTNLISAFAPMNFFAPIYFILGLLIFAVVAELALIIFKMGVFIINLFRGSGA